MARTRILHITKFLPPSSGGIEGVTLAMAKAGRDFCEQISILGASSDRSTSDRFMGTIRLVNMPILCKIGPVPIVTRLRTLRKEVLSHDIVHVHLPNPLMELALVLILLTTSRSRRPVVVPVAHVGILRFRPLALLWELTVQRCLLSLANYIFAAAPQIVQYFLTFRSFTSKTICIPYTSEYPTQLEAYDNGRPYMMAVGRLVAYKGYDDLIRAFSQIESDFDLLIVGDGPEKLKLQSLIDDLGVQNVKLMGRVSDLEKHRILKGCSLAAMSSISAQEAFGICIVEAFSYGKPVVAANLSTGVAYLTRGGRCGAVYPPGDVEALRQAIDQLVGDELGRRRSGEQNRLFWEQNLAPHIFEDSYKQWILPDVHRTKPVEASDDQKTA